MLEMLLCSMLTILPDYLFRRYAQGKRIGKEITFYTVWFELRWGITGCLILTVALITTVFYNHPATTSVTLYFRTVPIELEEAALVDGAHRGKAVWYVVLPLALPGLIAAAIFTFILAWNDFLFALVLITSEELKTLPVGVNDLFNATIVDWGMIMAAGVMITVPTVAFFVAIQRYLIQGWGAGGVKG